MSVRAPSFPPVEETLHGVRVHDPYRWLEDRSLPETARWIEEQGVRCEAYFSDCPAIDALRNRVRKLLNIEVVDQPARIGSLSFYRRRNRNQEQACIYALDSDTGRERLLVDPSGQGPFTSVGIYRISDDASLLAYQVRRGGGDATEIRIVDVGYGHALPDGIASGYARGFAFASHEHGFYYCHEFSSKSENSSIRFHSFHDSAIDRVIFERVCSRGSRLVLTADSIQLGAMWVYQCGTETVGDFFVASQERDGDWQAVFVKKKLPHRPMLYRGRIFVLSYEDAPNGKIVELTLGGRELRTVVPEGEVAPHQVEIAGGGFFLSYLRNGRPSIHRWTMAGEDEGDIEIPANGTIRMLPQLGSQEDGLFFTYESFAQPPSIYEFIPAAGNSQIWHQGVPSAKADRYIVGERSFPARDGTVIPVTLVARNGREESAERSAIMTSYGGFGVSMTPQFSALVAIMIDLGAVFVLPHIRGGGEFGKPWHDAGCGWNRQTAIYDFIAAAEWLFTSEIASPAKLAIFGGSNSGLLVGAAMTQRPDLFRAALSIAPLLDMVRYESFDQAAKWKAEYGSVQNAEDFHALLAYSPYHNVQRNVNYPATLFVTGDCDDRCNPAHVRKMAARLQKGETQTSPILVDYSEKRGHSAALPLSVRVDALARRLAFLSRELGIEVPAEVRHGVAGS